MTTASTRPEDNQPTAEELLAALEAEIAAKLADLEAAK